MKGSATNTQEHFGFHFYLLMPCNKLSHGHYELELGIESYHHKAVKKGGLRLGTTNILSHNMEISLTNYINSGPTCRLSNSADKFKPCDKVIISKAFIIRGPPSFLCTFSVT